MFVLPFALIPAAMSGPGPLGPRRERTRGLVEVPENAVRDEPIAFGLTGVQLGICAVAVLVAAILNLLPIWEPIRLVLVLLGAGPIALAAALPVRGEPAYRWIVRAVRYRRGRRCWNAELQAQISRSKRLDDTGGVRGLIRDDRTACPSGRRGAGGAAGNTSRALAGPRLRLVGSETTRSGIRSALKPVPHLLGGLHVVCFLSFAGGVGKTTLAVEAASLVGSRARYRTLDGEVARSGCCSSMRPGRARRPHLRLGLDPEAVSRSSTRYDWPDSLTFEKRAVETRFGVTLLSLPAAAAAGTRSRPSRSVRSRPPRSSTRPSRRASSSSSSTSARSSRRATATSSARRMSCSASSRRGSRRCPTSCGSPPTFAPWARAASSGSSPTRRPTRARCRRSPTGSRSRSWRPSRASRRSMPPATAASRRGRTILIEGTPSTAGDGGLAAVPGRPVVDDHRFGLASTVVGASGARRTAMNRSADRARGRPPVSARPRLRSVSPARRSPGAGDPQPVRSDTEREATLRAAIGEILADPELELAATPAMVAAVEAAICGLGPLQPLVDDPEVSDILVNAPDAIFAERAGRLEATDITLASARRADRHRPADRRPRRARAIGRPPDRRCPDARRVARQRRSSRRSAGRTSRSASSTASGSISRPAAGMAATG